MSMRKLSRALWCLALAALIAASSLCALATETQTDTVTLRVEGISQNLIYDTAAALGESATALEVLTSALDSRGIPFDAAGGYVSRIGEEAAGAFGGWDGWVYYVNGQEPSVGMADYVLEPGDSLLVCYADPYGTPPTLLPQVSVTVFAGGQSVRFAFTANVTEYDAQGVGTVQTVPVADAAVTIEGVAYTSDADGVVTLARQLLVHERAAVQIEKSTLAGKPLAVRLAPDFTVDLPFNSLSFSDVSPNAWYRDYVLELVARGAVGGYGDGTFRPTREITRAEFVKILACTDPNFDAGQKFSVYFTDVQAADWFAPYVTWAVEQGIVEKGGLFSPNVLLARQDMALIAYKYAVKVLGKTLPADQSAPAFMDEADIDASCREAVYLLQKAGVIEGIRSQDGFVFLPQGFTVRSEVSKVVVKLINLP